MVERGARGIAGKAEAGCGIGLWVAVNERDADFGSSERGREIDGGGGFADPALLIGDRDYFSQIEPPGVRIASKFKFSSQREKSKGKNWAGGLNVSRETFGAFLSAKMFPVKHF